MTQRSLTATLARALGVLALVALVVGVAGIHLGLLTPIQGFQTAALGALLGLIAVICGIIGLVRTRVKTGLAGAGRARLGLALGAAVVALLIGPALGSGGAPPIHDVTTDLDDPPSFSEAVRTASDRMNGVDYPDPPDAQVPEQQRAAFPDLAPIDVASPPAETLQRAEQIAGQLGWTVSRTDAASGVIEAYHVSRVFRFVDDVVIRVRPRASGSRVDLRSNSRVGGGDLGANAARIRAFRDALTASSN